METVGKILHGSLKTLEEVGEALGIRNLDPDSGLIFITGGTGVVGHRVAMKLLQAGYPHVRLGVMNPDTVEDKNKMGAEIADFSWNREDTYEKALHGVKSVLVTIPYCHYWDTHFNAFFNACLKAGVKHFVKLSFYHARVCAGDTAADPLFREVPLIKAHGDCDQLVVKTLTTTGLSRVDVVKPNVSYTILYASHLMSNPLTFYSNELHDPKMKPVTFYGASLNRGVNYISPNDVAEVAVRVLLEPCAHHNKEYTLTGPEAIKDQRVAVLLSKHLDKSVMYVDQKLDEFETELKVGGMADWLVRDLVGLEKIKASGNEEKQEFYSDDFETICGHRPQTFVEYLMTKDLMTPVEAGAEDALKPLKDTIA